MRLFRYLVLLLLPCSSPAQYHIYGSVTDQTNNIGLQGATVFIDGSSYATLTDSGGHFEFPNLPVKMVQIIVAKTGFTTGIYRADVKTENLKIVFQLNPEDEQADNIPQDSLTRAIQTWSEVFLSSFMGTSVNSYNCYITNPKVLRFRFIDSLGALSVTATEPLQILNESLGYMLFYYLNGIYIRNREIVYNSSYHFFKEMKSKQPAIVARWNVNRSNNFKGSLLHFMRAFYSFKLDEEGFRVRSVNRIYEGEAGFHKAANTAGSSTGKVIIMDSSGLPTLRMFAEFVERTPLPAESYTQTLEKETWLIQPRSGFQVTYLKPGQPLVSFLGIKGGKLFVEANGLYFDSQDVVKGGYWKSLGVADALPCNY